MKSSGLVSTFLLAFVPLTFAQPQTVSPTDVTAEHVGKNLSVEGQVYTVSKTNAGMHLYFGADTSTAFQALIPSSAIYKFQVDIEKKFSSRHVRATGKVEQENGRLFIRIEDSSQLKVVPRRRKTS